MHTEKLVAWMAISEFTAKWPEAASGATAMAANTSRTGYLKTLQIMVYLVKKTMYRVKSQFRNTTLFPSGRGPLLALSAARRAGDPPVHHIASAGPGRAPACSGRSKSRNLASNHGIVSRSVDAN